MKELQQYSTRVLRDAIGELLVPTEYSLLQVYLVSDVDAALKSQAEEIKRLREALEKIEHNGCTEDAHIARTALAPQDAPEEGGS